VVAGRSTLLRAELAYVAGSAATLIAMTALLWRPLRQATGDDTALLAAVRTEPVEP
jgi:hypothetical protein